MVSPISSPGRHVTRKKKIHPIKRNGGVLVVAKENEQADALVGRKIMCKWDGTGWCVREIRTRNTDSEFLCLL